MGTERTHRREGGCGGCKAHAPRSSSVPSSCKTAFVRPGLVVLLVHCLSCSRERWEMAQARRSEVLCLWGGLMGGWQVAWKVCHKAGTAAGRLQEVVFGESGRRRAYLSKMPPVGPSICIQSPTASCWRKCCEGCYGRELGHCTNSAPPGQPVSTPAVHLPSPCCHSSRVFIKVLDCVSQGGHNQRREDLSTVRCLLTAGADGQLNARIIC